jgi:hypothetical protein
MLWRCLGCNYSSDTSRGLANHRRRCEASQTALHTRIGELRRNQQDQAAVQHLAEEQVEMEVDVEHADVRLSIVLCLNNPPKLGCAAHPGCSVSPIWSSLPSNKASEIVP